MGVCKSTNIFQENISKLFDGFDMVGAYIDNVLVINKNNFKDHLKSLDRVLQRHVKAVLKVTQKNTSSDKQKLNNLVSG